MGLLNLPPELFLWFVRVCVSQHGVTSAWKMRGVSRTFKVYFTEVILSEIPVSDFPGTYPYNGRKIFENNLSCYLWYRVTTPRGADQFLPTFINKVLDRIGGISGTIEKVIRDRFADVLCDVLVHHFAVSFGMDELIRFSTARTGYNRKLMNQFHKTMDLATIAATAAIGDMDALDALLRHAPNGLWYRSYAFGSPFSAAAYAGQGAVIETALQQLASIQGPLDWSVCGEQLVQGISFSLQSRHPEVAKQILNVHDEYFPKLLSNYFKDWLQMAKAIGDTDTFLVIEGLHRPAYEHTRAFVEACTAGDITCVRQLVEKNLVKINQRTRDDYSFFILAVLQGTPAIVEMLLALGAKVDGLKLKGLEGNHGGRASRPLKGVDLDNPLLAAVDNERWDMVKVLLDHNANLQVFVPMDFTPAHLMYGAPTAENVQKTKHEGWSLKLSMLKKIWVHFQGTTELSPDVCQRLLAEMGR